LICPNCGTDNAAASRFCDECGTALSANCPNCGEPHRPGAKFCANCGFALGGAQVTSTAAGAAPAVAHGAVAERRLVTVLFVDLVGFTPFAEERDAEQVRETLDRYFGIARLAVERHGGTIEKFIGDAVMAVWGTPTAHEDDAERAVRAAMELLDGVSGLGEGISARAGVLTGEAAVTIGAEGQGMVAGDLVNTASRLQSVAPAGTILVSAATMHAASAAIVFEPAGEHELKGKSAPVEAYRAVRVVANRGGQMRSEALEAPFVGREEELRLLKEQLHATTRDGRARLVSITGPAGIGKSRLTWEFEKYIDGVVETIYWHRGRSPAYGEGVTFWALGEMVRRRADLAETDDEDTTRERISASVEQLVDDPEDRTWIANSLLTLLGVEPAPAGGRDVLFAAWRTYFEHIAAQGTTVLVFEDIQWADTGVLDFIDNLLEWSRNSALLVITLARPELYERRSDWGSRHRLMTAIPLDPLPEDKMRELLAGLVPGMPEQAIVTILGRADGIPLYAVETVRMLVADGRVEAVDGAYRPVGDLTELAVPETLRSLIASRLDALETTDRSLLQDAAVIGQRFTIDALSSVSGLPADDIETRLRKLVKREMLDLEVDPRSPERGQYGFVQSLIREVAYGTLAKKDRRSRHLAAARYFETIGDDELAGMLASHYLAAHEASAEGAEADAVAAQARIALRAAAERAAALGAHAQALSYLEQALTITDQPLDRASMLEMASDSADIASDPERAADLARDALAIYADTDDYVARARAASLLGRSLIDGGHLEQAADEMRSELEKLDAAEDSDAVAQLLATLSRAYMRLDMNTEAVAAADRALTIAEPRNLEQIVAEALINKGSALSNLSGRRREAAALLAKAVEIAAARGWIETELRGRNNLSASIVDDDPRRALDYIEGSAVIARRLGQRGVLNWQTGTRAMYAHTVGLDWDAALAAVEEILANDILGEADRIRLAVVRATFLANRGELETGDADELDRLTATSEPQTRGLWIHTRAMIALTQHRYPEAIRLSEDALGGWQNYAALFWPTAFVAAAFSSDSETAGRLAKSMSEYPIGANWELGLRDWMNGGALAMDGRADDGLRLVRSGIERLSGIDAHWSAALAMLAAIRLFPRAPDVQGWRASARETFDRLRARPFLAMLDETVVTALHETADQSSAARAEAVSTSS
jgi:class 3 adenylate cyclase/tetratricopeptide (TPR) repeat protein